jgi:hypothetical protein
MLGKGVSIFNFIIQYEDGSWIDLHRDKNIWVSSFHIYSPKVNHETERIDGRHGLSLIETTLLERKITASFSVEANTPEELEEIRENLIRIFNPLRPFYIIKDLQDKSAVKKRMKVVIDSEFDFKYLTLEDGEFDIDFTLLSPFFESAGTTLHPEDGFYGSYGSYHTSLTIAGKNYNYDLNSSDLSYTHNTNSFRIFNDGDIAVDPRIHEIKITFTGQSESLIIRNKATNEEFSYNGATSDTDVLILDGIRTFKNGQSVFGQTNKKLLTIEKGLNDFEVLGTTGPFTISFDFRYYYF